MQIAGRVRGNVSCRRKAARCSPGRISHRIVSEVNVASEGWDVLWQTTNVDQNQDHKRLSVAVRLYARSMVLNSIPESAKREARLSRRNADPSFMLKLVKKVASPLSVNKALRSIQRSVKKAANMDALLPPTKKCRGPIYRVRILLQKRRRIHILGF